MVTQRDIQAEVTRERIMQTAAEEIFRVGFQAASVGEILRKIGVSKGCFYHHFPTKQDLGYAVLEESFARMQIELWEPALMSKDPLAALIKMLAEVSKNVKCEQIKLGCPINNLAQEMSPVDEGFRKRVENIYQMWRRRLGDALLRAQKEQQMDTTVDADEVATMIMAVTQGAVGIAKNAQQPKVFTDFTRGLIRYLRSLQTHR